MMRGTTATNTVRVITIVVGAVFSSLAYHTANQGSSSGFGIQAIQIHAYNAGQNLL